MAGISAAPVSAHCHSYWSSASLKPSTRQFYHLTTRLRGLCAEFGLLLTAEPNAEQRFGYSLCVVRKRSLWIGPATCIVAVKVDANDSLCDRVDTD
jgi:hypothetical protein